MSDNNQNQGDKQQQQPGKSPKTKSNTFRPKPQAPKSNTLSAFRNVQPRTDTHKASSAP
jgi:hypothetical protein